MHTYFIPLQSINIITCSVCVNTLQWILKLIGRIILIKRLGLTFEACTMYVHNWLIEAKTSNFGLVVMQNSIEPSSGSKFEEDSLRSICYMALLVQFHSEYFFINNIWLIRTDFFVPSGIIFHVKNILFPLQKLKLAKAYIKRDFTNYRP